MNLDKTQVFCQVEAPDVAFQTLALKMCYSGKKKVQLARHSKLSVKGGLDGDLLNSLDLELDTELDGLVLYTEGCPPPKVYIYLNFL